MTYITGHDRSQMLLLPEAVDDNVGSDNPVRFIDVFVESQRPVEWIYFEHWRPMAVNLYRRLFSRLKACASTCCGESTE